MSRPIVQLHTIEQWNQLDPSLRPIILQNLRVKDRLWSWLYEKRNQKKGGQGAVLGPHWVPCLDCGTRGWIERHPRYPGIHPSALANTCLRRIYNEMIGAEGQEDIDARSILIFDLGSAIHRMFQHYGKQGAWGPIYKEEVEISGEYQEIADLLMIEGHADGDNIITVDNIPNAPIFEVGVVHEYKSIKAEQYAKLTKPKPEHRVQAMIYSKALNRPVTVFVYFCKNDSNITDYPIAFDETTWSQTEAKCRELLGYYDSGTPAPATTGYHCNECPYNQNCPEYAEEIMRRKAGSR